MTPALTFLPPHRGRDRPRLALALAVALSAGTIALALTSGRATAADDQTRALIRTLDPLPPVSMETVQPPAPSIEPVVTEPAAPAASTPLDPAPPTAPATNAMDPAPLPSTHAAEDTPVIGDQRSGTDSTQEERAEPGSVAASATTADGALEWQWSPSGRAPTASAQLIPIAPTIGGAVATPPRPTAPAPTPAPIDAPDVAPRPTPPAGRDPLPVATPPPAPEDLASTDTLGLNGADVIRPVQHRLPVGVHRDGDLIIATVGKAIEIPVDRPFQDVVVPRPEVAEVVVLQPGKVFVATRGVGSTNLLLVDTRGRVVRNVEVVVEADLEGLRRALAKIMPNSRIEVTPTQGGVVLTGQVGSVAAADNAARVAAQFAGGDGGEVINSLAVAGDQQVLLNVTVAEMNRTVRKVMDNSLSFNTGTGDSLFEGTALDAIAGGPLVEVDGLVNPGSGTIRISDPAGNTLNIEQLEEQRLIKVLAEPSLTAISGETANFLAGGEFPVPVGRDQDGRVIIEFKEFGVGLSFTPVVLSDNQISLRVRTEVSRIADEFTFVLDNLVIPGLSVRRANSTVMLPSGGSLMIAGLLQDEDRNAVQGFPGLKDLPVLGALFRSHDFENQRSELVVLVQAFKVRPREFGPTLSAPTDGFKPADDIDIYLFGKLHDRYGGGPGTGDRPAFSVSAPVGYIME